jgi:hypothetical protein
LTSSSVYRYYDAGLLDGHLPKIHKLSSLATGRAGESRPLVITEGTAKMKQMTAIPTTNVGEQHINSSQIWQASTPTTKRIPGGFRRNYPRRVRNWAPTCSTRFFPAPRRKDGANQWAMEHGG